MYDKNNIFAKIARGEIPCKVIAENGHALSFYDINPLFEKHALIIPRGEYVNMLDFVTRAPAAVQAGFWDCFAKTADVLGVDGDFNVFANAGADAPFFKQTVFHFHLHLVSGTRTDAFVKEMEQVCK